MSFWSREVSQTGRRTWTSHMIDSLDVCNRWPHSGLRVLILLGIASSNYRPFGVPVLVLSSCCWGMLAGSEGLGGIRFDDYSLAHAIGTVALVLILFDGGLGTSLEAVRQVWKPAFALATIGVLVTPY